MHDNTPPHKPVYYLEEEIREAEEGEQIYYDDEIREGDEEEYVYYEEDIFSDEEKDPQEIGDALAHRIPERDDAVITFDKHKAPVFCCSIHPSEDIVATGGEDDCVYIWNFKTGEIIHEITTHRDSVIAAAFNYDGKYLATGDLSGELQVLKIKDNWKRVWDFSMGDMCWMKWHKAANVLLAGSEEGEIYIWRIPSGDCKILPGYGQKCESAELTSDGKSIFAGYGDGTVKLWNIKTCSVIVEVNCNHPEGLHESVSTVSCAEDRSLYMAGGEDGKIILVSNSGPVGMLQPSADAVEAVAFCPDPDLNVAASGTLDGQVAIWDIQKQTLRCICDYSVENGITILKWLPELTLLCGTLEGSVLAFDGRSGAKKFDLQGHFAEVYDMCYDKKREILVTTSEDCTSKVFKVTL